MKDYGHPETANGWHFLTGDLDSIKRVTDAVGFRYKWDVYTATFAHASAIYVLTPEGKLSKYFYGIEYSPKDMRLGLVEASQNKIGNAVDQILLFCYHFDPTSAKYTLFALDILRVAGAATVLTLGGFVFIMLRQRQQAERESSRLTKYGRKEFPAFSGSGVVHRRSGRRRSTRTWCWSARFSRC